MTISDEQLVMDRVEVLGSEGGDLMVVWCDELSKSFSARIGSVHTSLNSGGTETVQGWHGLGCGATKCDEYHAL